MHTTSISFNLPLAEHQIPRFRQSILQIEGLDHRLYHNSNFDEEGNQLNQHRYPLIQYRTFEGYANIWALNEGAKQLESDLKKKKLQTFFWHRKPMDVALIRHFSNAADAAEFTGDRFIRYHLKNYLPLSNNKSGRGEESSYDRFEKAEIFAEKIKVIERVIVSHLILFSYAAGWQLSPNQQLQSKIIDITDVSRGVYKKQSHEKEKYFRKFDLIVAVNARLPDGIAIGNQVSLGYGVLTGLDE